MGRSNRMNPNPRHIAREAEHDAKYAIQTRQRALDIDTSDVEWPDRKLRFGRDRLVWGIERDYLLAAKTLNQQTQANGGPTGHESLELRHFLHAERLFRKQEEYVKRLGMVHMIRRAPVGSDLRIDWYENYRHHHRNKMKPLRLGASTRYLAGMVTCVGEGSKPIKRRNRALIR